MELFSPSSHIKHPRPINISSSPCIYSRLLPQLACFHPGAALVPAYRVPLTNGSVNERCRTRTFRPDTITAILLYPLSFRLVI